MSEPMTCPGCGANVREEHFSYRRFECMTLEFDAFGPIQYELRESADCLRRQLSQAEARIKELEAQRERTATETDALRRAINGVVPTDPRRFEDLDLCVALNNYHDRVEWLPIVRAAGVLSEEGQTLDTRPTWVERAWAVIYAFRALTPEQRARIEEVEHGCSGGTHRSCQSVRNE